MINHRLVPIRILSLVPFLAAVPAIILWSSAVAAGQEKADRLARSGPSVWDARDFAFQHVVLRNAIDQVAQTIRLNVVYHVSSLAIADHTNCDLALTHASAGDAISALLSANGLACVQIDRRAIMIVKEGTGGRPLRSVDSLIAKTESEEAGDNNKDASDPAKALKPRDVRVKSLSLTTTADFIAKAARLRIMFDPTLEAWAKATSLTIELRNVTLAQALKYLLQSYDLTYEQVNGDTLNIVRKSHEQSPTPLEEIIRNLQ